jgi:hypothetical protein
LWNWSIEEEDKYDITYTVSCSVCQAGIQKSLVLCAPLVRASRQIRTLSGLRLKCDGTRAETRFRLPEKRTSPFKSVGTSVQSTTGSRGVRISVSNAGYTMFRGSLKSTGYPLHSPVSLSLPLPFVTVCHHISTGRYSKLSLQTSIQHETK